MFAFRELFTFLRSGFRLTWTWILASVMLFSLDLATIAGLIWRFFFRNKYTFNPDTIITVSLIYLALTAVLGILAFGFGKLRSVQTVVTFYGSVGIFFLISGIADSTDREFAVWPWVVVWIVILAMTVFQFSAEIEPKKNTPQN